MAVFCPPPTDATTIDYVYIIDDSTGTTCGNSAVDDSTAGWVYGNGYSADPPAVYEWVTPELPIWLGWGWAACPCASGLPLVILNIQSRVPL